MARVKPVSIDLKFGLIVGLVAVVMVGLGALLKWKEFYEFFAPAGVFNAWKLASAVFLAAGITIWFFMNHFWKREVDVNQDLQLRLEHAENLLKSSELQHLTDPITGVPNIRSLESDFNSYIVNTDLQRPKVQFVFIDLKDFGKINKDFQSRKGSKLIRYIAQSIYLGMRRNENMFKLPAAEEKSKANKGSFYRIFPGGDEFVFIIEGDQAEAIGFVNRLRSQFDEFTKATPTILGELRPLSFYCSIVQMDPMDRSLPDILERAEICYRSVWSAATREFAVMWYPENVEAALSADERKRQQYSRIRELFEVIPVVER